MSKFSIAAAALCAAAAFSSPAVASVVSSPLEGSPAAVNFSVLDTSVSFAAFYLKTDPLTGGVSMTFTADHDVLITGMSVSGVDTSSGDDLDNISFSLTNGATGDSSFDITVNGTVGAGIAFFDDFVMSGGETVSLVFDTLPLDRTVTLGMNFATAPVPVPAALPLMLTALGGLAVARSRKS